MSLTINGLEGSYPDHGFQLGPLDAVVEKNRTVALIGPNGSGKSTLFRILVGAHPPGGGEAWWDDLNLIECSARTRARKVAWLRQNPMCSFNFTVENIIRMGTYPRDADDIESVMELVGVTPLAGRTIDTLSGGERRRVFLARALAQRPELLLLDEPTAQLDLKFCWSLPDLLDRAREQFGGLTVLWAQHDLEQASRVATQFLLLDGGDLLASGDRDTVMAAENLSAAYGVPLSVHRDPHQPGLSITPD